jgi:cyclic pyranopterin phosphate synthase
MPVIKDNNWASLTVPGNEILERISEKFSFSPVENRELAGPAREYRIEGGVGTIGVITPISGHFCQGCNRIRVTSTGIARGCLFSNAETDLKPYVRTYDTRGLHQALHQLVTSKPDMHQLSARQADHSPFPMARIGG